MPTNPIPIRSQPGIQRDGTQFSAKSYVDGIWCRFQRGLPRKIGGYVTLTDTLPEIVYGMSSFSYGGTIYQHVGSTSYLYQVRANSGGTFSGLSNRTPATDFNPNPNNLWQMDFYPTQEGTAPRVVVHPGQNLSDIDNAVETAFFIGDVNSTAPLTKIGEQPVSGGLVSWYPYLIAFSNNGRVDIYDINDLTLAAESGIVTGSKIIRGLSLRGGGGGPSGLLWSLDSLIRGTFQSADPSASPFAFDTIAEDISVMSSRGIISHLGVYYWAGVDCFYMFNGVVREIPNTFNSNFFFDNVNFSQRQKVFAYKVPRFGEIWWCFPRGNATECNWAVVYNFREGFWYDTPLPASGRSDGIFAKVYNKPFMAGIDPVVNTYPLWQHETGTDAINGSSVQPIRSYFETGDISLLSSDQPMSKSLRVERVEPDFVQAGDMKMTVTGSANARASAIDSAEKTFPPGPTSADEQTVTLKDGVRRLLRFRFESNTVGGNYEMGSCIGHVEPNDGRVTQ
jgi:hypothetical protein